MTTQDDKRKQVRIIFRTDRVTYNRLVDLAGQEKRSLSSLVNYLVSQALIAAQRGGKEGE